MDIVLAAGDAAWESRALHELESSTTVRLVRRCVDVADLLAAADGERAQAALVSVDLVGLDVDTVHRLEQAGVRVAAVQADPARCSTVGISRIVQLGELDEIARDTPASTTTSSGKSSGQSAPLVAVWGPAGAPGRSTVALALAAATAAHGTDTVVVDADTYGGSVAQLLSVLDEVSGLVAACRTVNQGRSHQVVEQLLDIDPQLRLLTGLPRADMWTQVRPGALDVVLSQLRLASELVVVDCGFCLEPGSAPGQGRNQTTLQVLDLADALVVVGKPDPVGLSRLIRGLHDLRDVVTTAPPIIVVNQMRPSLGWGERELRSTVLRLTGQQPAVFLPLDQPGVDLAVMNGRSAREAVPSSPFVARVEGLTTAVMDAVSPRAVLAAADT